MHREVDSEQIASFGFNCGLQRLSYPREAARKLKTTTSCMCTMKCTWRMNISSYSWSSFSALGQSCSSRRTWRWMFCRRWACGRCVEDVFAFRPTTDFGKSSAQSCFQRLWWFHPFVCDGLRLARIAYQHVFSKLNLKPGHCLNRCADLTKGADPIPLVFISPANCFPKCFFSSFSRVLNAACFSSWGLFLLNTSYIVNSWKLKAWTRH